MVPQKEAIWARLVGLAKEVPSFGLAKLGKKKEFTPQTDLVSDLGLVGYDAAEFMGKYAAAFSVNQGDYDAAAYFDSEGLWILPSLRKKKGKKRLTLGMLYLAAKNGVWATAELERARLNNRYE